MVKHRSAILSGKKLKTVLIITYYWPPAGGPGVQRVLKFAKYLPQNGWRPIVLTVKNGEYPAIDQSLVAEIPEICRVYKTFSLEPNTLYKKFTGMSPDEGIPVAVLTEQKGNWKKQLANKIRLNLFIPDAKIGWIPFAVRRGKQIIRKEKPDIILSSSPPPTVHLIAQKLAKWSGIKWVADFRDPWTNIYHYHKAPKCRLSKRIDLQLEQSVLKAADRITAVTDGFFTSEVQKPIMVIPNGFDAEDYRWLDKIQKSAPDKIFTICYMGSLKSRQYIDSFYRVLSDIQRNHVRNRMKIQLKFVGRVDAAIRQKVIQHDIGLSPIFTGYLDHPEALKHAAGADLLLLIIGKSHIAHRIVTGKLFEYLILQKPILAYGPRQGAAHRVLQETGAGELFDYDDIRGPQRFILEQFHNWQDNQKFNIDLKSVDKYNRKYLTKQLINLFEELL